jgi:hypothetical protein
VLPIKVAVKELGPSPALTGFLWGVAVSVIGLNLMVI